MEPENAPESNCTRAGAGVEMVYGYGTRSFLRSTEHRQMAEERKKATAEFEQTKRSKIELPVACTCREYEYPHLHLKGAGKKYFTGVVGNSVD